jgi:hypothetical protein
MFAIYCCYDVNGKLIYNKSSLIGIYDEFYIAKNDLLSTLHNKKCNVEIIDDENNYLFIKLLAKDGIDKTENYKQIHYEIKKLNMEINKLKMKYR